MHVSTARACLHLLENICRYSQDALEPQALPPLPQCLPLLGGSTALRRLSVVSAYDMSTEVRLCVCVCVRARVCVAGGACRAALDWDGVRDA